MCTLAWNRLQVSLLILPYGLVVDDEEVVMGHPCSVFTKVRIPLAYLLGE